MRAGRLQSELGLLKSARNGYTSMTDSGAKTARELSSSSDEQERTSTDEMLSVVPVHDMVLFPGAVHDIVVDRPASIAAVQSALRESGKLGLLLQRDAAVTDFGPGDLYEVGTVVRVLRCGRDTDESHLLTGRGEARFRVVAFMAQHPHLVARIEKPEELLTNKEEIRALVLVLKRQASRAIELLPGIPAELVASIQSIESPSALSDLIAGFLDIPAGEKQKLLETFDIRKRLETVIEYMAKWLAIIELSHPIREQTRS
jgi:ATP-dependent Lon protease